jgi:hypothetical protein
MIHLFIDRRLRMNIYRQRNSTLLFIYLYSTHYMFRLEMGHLQVLQVPHKLHLFLNVIMQV